jgi:hypothetical protein
MSVALRYLTLQEVSGMTEKLAGMCRQLGVSQGDLDRCIDSALMPLMIQLEATRAAEADRRAKIKLVSED